MRTADTGGQAACTTPSVCFPLGRVVEKSENSLETALVFGVRRLLKERQVIKLNRDPTEARRGDRAGWPAGGGNVVSETRIASISGLRGLVGNGLDPVVVVEFAAAYASQCEPGAIVLSAMMGASHRRYSSLPSLRE